MRPSIAQSFSPVLTPQPPGQKNLASWYTQGHSDALGDRLLMFDNTETPSLELLRFRPELVAWPRFEEKLHERTELLSQFRHVSFPRVRAVEHLGPDGGLTLVSDHVAGKRLSDTLHALPGPAFSLLLIRELTPALVMLQQQGRGVGHGAITPDRIVLQRDGQLVIVEHVVGPALEQLQLSCRELWSRFGIAAIGHSAAAARLDCRADVIQFGLIALSVLLGRRLTPDEYPDGFGQLLEAVSQTADRRLPPFLRVWLERALQLSGRPFECARDAHDALTEFAFEINYRGAEMIADSSSTLRLGLSAMPESTALAGTLPILVEKSSTDAGNGSVGVIDVDSIPAQANREDEEDHRQRGRLGGRQIAARDWLMAALVIFSLGQTGFISYLLAARGSDMPVSPAAILIESPQPGADVVMDGRLVGTTPLTLRLGTSTRSIRISDGGGSPSPREGMQTASIQDNQHAPAGTIPISARAAAAPVASGGIRLVSPIEVQLLHGDRVLGSSASGPIVMPPGRYEVELVNSEFGFRSRQVVDIKAGRVVSLPLPRPSGNLNINAQPWANVWIDGESVGETPLANLSVGVGQHEVVFRHPSFGEQRKTVLVRSDAVTRVTADLR